MIEVTMDECIERKKKHATFAKVYNWLYEQFNDKKVLLVYPFELVDKLKVTHQRAWQILNHFYELGFLNKRSDGANVYFTPVKNGDSLLLEKYIGKINEELEKKGLLPK